MRVVTHNGQFHADEALALAILRRYAGVIEVERSRDPAVLASAAILVDVGGEYDHGKGRYDHHQRGGAGARPNGVPYASAGLIWRHYGAVVCASRLPDAQHLYSEVSTIVDERFVQLIDAADCGYSTSQPMFEGIPAGYSFSMFLASLNPSWHEDQSPELVLKDFNEAISLAGIALSRAIENAIGLVKGRGIVTAAIATAADPRIIILERFAPWGDVILESAPEALYVVFPSQEGTWMVQQCPKAARSFEGRKPLPEDWAGLRDEAFEKASGTPGAVFCHPGRFVCGARDRLGAIKLATLAVMA